MSIMENKDLTGIVIPEVKKGYPIGEPHFRDIFGDTDGDVDFPEELFKNIPEVATHWDRYNDSQLWDKKRFHSGKYQIVACVGTPEDYSYETVDSTDKWKEARRLMNEGADVYCNGKRVYFVDHAAVDEAFKTLKGLYLTRQSYMWDDDFEDIEDHIAFEEAAKILEQNGFKADEVWGEKVWNRYEDRWHDPLTTPLLERPRFLFRAIETDDLPF